MPSGLLAWVDDQLQSRNMECYTDSLGNPQLKVKIGASWRTFNLKDRQVKDVLSVKLDGGGLPLRREIVAVTGYLRRLAMDNSRLESTDREILKALENDQLLAVLVLFLADIENFPFEEDAGIFYTALRTHIKTKNLKLTGRRFPGAPNVMSRRLRFIFEQGLLPPFGFEGELLPRSDGRQLRFDKATPAGRSVAPILGPSAPPSAPSPPPQNDLRPSDDPDDERNELAEKLPT